MDVTLHVPDVEGGGLHDPFPHWLHSDAVRYDVQRLDVGIDMSGGWYYFFLLPIIQHVLHRDTDGEHLVPLCHQEAGKLNLTSAHSTGSEPGKEQLEEKTEADILLSESGVWSELQETVL